MDANKEDLFESEDSGVKGAKLYKTDKLPEKFSDTGFQVINGKTDYKIIGAAHVEARDNFDEWDGIMIEHTAKKRRFVVSLNAFLGQSFVQSEDESWKRSEIPNRTFECANDVLQAFGQTFKTDAGTELESQIFESGKPVKGKTVKKRFYNFKRVGE